MRDTWPRNGILRVEIVRGDAQIQDFTMEETYSQKDKTDFASIFGTGLGRDGLVLSYLSFKLYMGENNI